MWRSPVVDVMIPDWLVCEVEEGWEGMLMLWEGRREGRGKA